VIGLLIAGLLLIVAAGGSSSKGSKALPAGMTEAERDVVCVLLRAGVPMESLTETLARELYPAGSWPVSDVWSVEDIAAMPEPTRAKYENAARIAKLATSKSVVDFCFESVQLEPYATGSIEKTDAGFRVQWQADKTAESVEISDDMPRNSPLYFARESTLPNLDAARAELYRGILFWGFRGMGSGVPETAAFVAGNFFGELPNAPNAEAAGRRFSVWRLNESLSYLMTTDDSGLAEVSMHQSVDDALAAAQNGDLYP